MLLKRICLLTAFAVLCASTTNAQDFNQPENKQILFKHLPELGIDLKQWTDTHISSTYTDARTGITFLYLQQQYQQIDIFNSMISAAFKNGQLLYHSGKFVPTSQLSLNNQPAVAVTEAARLATAHLEITPSTPFQILTDRFAEEKKYTLSDNGIARRPIEAQLVWVNHNNTLSLAWNINIDLQQQEDWWNVRIHALTGAFLEKNNWTVHEQREKHDNARQSGTIKNHIPNKEQRQQVPATTSATYRVLAVPIESPNFGNPTIQSSPWNLFGVGNNATTLGWHNDSLLDYNFTRGNNVFTFLDISGNNAANASTNWPDTSTTPFPNLAFNQGPSFTQSPSLNTNKKFALNNLFYWNNMMHDVMYQYGFDEASGNFQSRNLGRGGLGNDFVNAHAQDGGGRNNANFSTPSDGSSGRMQMYLWDGNAVFNINAPASAAGSYLAIEGNLSTANALSDVGPITANVVYYNDDNAGTLHTGCVTARNGAQLAGKIALIDATNCTFVTKIKNAQNAGAVGVIVFTTNANPFTMGGSDNTITIPAVCVGSSTANVLVASLGSGLNVTLAAGIDLDGDLDNGVVCHEYGHGISNRLTGGPANSSCLSNDEQAGEGWSDYIGLMMTTNWSSAQLTDGSVRRAIGTYVVGQNATGRGIRRYPYSTDMTINPLTYANMAASTEVHNIGEIWCSAIWDMTWNIIQQEGTIAPNLFSGSAAGGNVIAMNLVMMGMKLQPCGPGYLDGRNAILAADSILYGYAHRCAIWNAFARRGMGINANQGTASLATDQTAGFNVPSSLNLNRLSPIFTSVNNQFTINRTAQCGCSALTGYVLRDTIPAGFTYVSSNPAGTLTGNVLSFPARSFNSNETKTYSITLQAPATGCAIDSLIYDNRESSTTGGFVSSGTPGWATSSIRSASGSSSWRVASSTAVSSSSLTSANTSALAAKNLSLLTFNHYFNTEPGYDGGLLEYSTNGTTWLDARNLFIKNGPTTLMDASTTLGNKRAFSGISNGFIQSMVNLTALGTTPVKFRFRSETDNGTSYEGWYVDDITRINGCGSYFKSGMYNGSGTSVDSTGTLVFVQPAGTVPLTLLNLNAKNLGQQVALSWTTANESNLRNFQIEFSANGINFQTIGSVNARNQAAQQYGFLHLQPVNGNNFYRLKMIDTDGRFRYSPIKVISRFNSEGPALLLLPNPVQQQATLIISKTLGATQIRILDVAGKLMQVIPLVGQSGSITINTHQMANGIYLIETDSKVEKAAIKMVVQH